MRCLLCIDSHCPGCQEPRERVPSTQRAERIRDEARAGRCTLRARDCGWDWDCVKHHPDTALRPSFPVGEAS